MRWPFASSSASGKRSRCDHSRKAAACVSGGASAPGRERWIRSPQASSRSLAADSLRCRSPVDVLLDQEARGEGEQQQHRHHRGVDAEVEALHAAGVSSASCLRANT